MHTNAWARNFVLKTKLAIIVCILILAGSFRPLKLYAQTPEQHVRAMAWSKDGQTLAVAGTFGVELYTNNLQSVSSLPEDAGDITAIAYSPSGSRFATTDISGIVKVWDSQTGHSLVSLQGHTDQAWRVSWSPDGTKLASGGKDKTVRIWNVGTGTLLTTLLGNEQVWSVAWSSDGSKLAFGGGNPSDLSKSFIQLWDATTFTLITNFDLTGLSPFVVTSLVWSPDSRRLMSGGGIPYVWDIATYHVIFDLISVSTTPSVDWSPDGNSLAVADVAAELVIWDATTGQIKTSMLGHNSAIVSVKWKPDSSQIATVSEDNTVRLWTPTTGVQLASALLPTVTLANLRAIIVGCDIAQDLQVSLYAKIAANDLPGFITQIQKAPETYIITDECISQSTQVATYLLDHQLKLTTICSANPTAYRAWKVANPNPYPVTFAWEVINSSSRQKGTANVSGTRIGSSPSEVTFQTTTEPGPNTVRIFVNGVQQSISDSNTSQCTQPTSSPTPSPSVTPTRTPTPPPTTLKLQYYPDPGAKGNITDGLMPDFNIVNTTGTAVPLNQLKIRYYFTRDTTDPSVTFRYVCSYTDLPNGCGGSTVVRGTVIKMATPVTGADSYIEISFTGGTLAANGQTNEILSYVNKSDWSNYTQNNDYSFDGTRGEVFTDWNKATLYRNGVLIWGTEPQ